MKLKFEVGDLVRVDFAGIDIALVGQTLPVIRVEKRSFGDDSDHDYVWLKGSSSFWMVDGENETGLTLMAAATNMDDTRSYLAAVTGETDG